MDHLPSIRQLQYLVALAETGSFSAAALQCHVTQSTLSAGIAALEDLLGQQLVDRSQRQISLTSLGHETVNKARQIIEDATAIVTRAQHIKRAPLSGPLRLGVIPTIAPYLLPRFLPNLCTRYPEMELQIHEDISSRLVTSLRQGTLDIVLMAFPYDMPGMTTRILFSEDFFVVSPKGFWGGRSSVKEKDLEGQSLLLLAEGHCLRDHALAACRLSQPADHKLFSATSLPTLVQMVEHGYGITLLPAMAVNYGPLSPKIDIARLGPNAPQRDIGLAWRTGHPRAQEFELFAKALAQILSA